MQVTLTARQCVTNAPENYDYGWAHTKIANLYTDDRGKIYRLVENDDDWHFNQQLMRYDSGMNVTITDQIDLDYRVKQGLLIPLPNPKPVFITTVDFKNKFKGCTSEEIEAILEVLEQTKITEGVNIETYNGGLTYYLTFTGNKETFEKIVAKLEPLTK